MAQYVDNSVIKILILVILIILFLKQFIYL